MKKFRILATAAFALIAATLVANAQAAKSISIDFDRCIIVIPDKRNEVVKYAIDELRDHIKLVSGVEVPVVKKTEKGKYPIFVGIRAPGDTSEFKSEEARWALTSNKGIYLYGMDKVGGKKGDIKTYKDAAISNDTRAGTLFAVYEFLEAHLGIRWIEPGPMGTAYTPIKGFTFTPYEGSYTPQLIQRVMRVAYKDALRTRALEDDDIPADMRFSDKEFEQRLDEELTWRRRMRMGRSVAKFTYGHAFTKWWAKYGKTHPEYFAMDKNGKRGPSGKSRADRVKMCVSNPDLPKQVAADHFTTNSSNLIVNACENDSRAFCNCDNCKALDVVLPGEENLAIDDRHLTDRYVYFVNAVLREARKINPKAQVAFYFYSRYNEPPRREKVSDGVIMFLLPNLGDPFDFNKYCQDWKAAGGRVVYLRPNDLCQDTGLPHGFEEKMFSKFKIANNNIKVIGTDYDTCWGFWPVSGVANYIMARGFYRPERTFEDWNREYCGAYGEAAADMEAYHTHWRGIWNNRVVPNLGKIGELTGSYKLLRSKLMQLTDLLYDENDFDKTDAILKTALTRNLNPWQKAKIENMQLANRHNRLKYRAVAVNRLASTATAEQQKSTAQALYDFRRQHRLDLNIHWELMMYLENKYEDNAGLKRLLDLKTKPGLLNEWTQNEAKFKELRGDYNTPLR